MKERKNERMNDTHSGFLILEDEEQTACVKLNDKRSESFSIANGTRQGSVLSPALFAFYLDELLARLRSLGVGSHVGGLWCCLFC